MILNQKKGFTLIELLLAVFILSIGISGILLLFTNSMMSSQSAWDMTVATSHADCILEGMYTVDSLEGIREIDWIKWAQEHELNTLPDESVEVVFNSKFDNLLEVNVAVGWIRNQRPKEVCLKTGFTR